MFLGPMNDPVPLIIVTGFLGAGKTTMLNRVLGAPHGRRIGVIINELGRIDIDTRLIKSRAGDVMELVGGCVCHEVRVQSELLGGGRRGRARSLPEVVILETTGIAEPWSILDGLEALPRRTAPVTAGVGGLRRRRRVGRAAAAAPRGGARAGRGRRSDPAVEAGSRRRRSRSSRIHRAARAAQRRRRARRLPRRGPRARRRWCPGCSISAGARAPRDARAAHAG